VRPDHPAPRWHDTFESQTLRAIGGERPSMKRYMTCVGVLLLAGMLVSCGGGGGGGGDSPSAGTTTGGGPGNNGTPPDNNGTPPTNGGSTPPSDGGSTPPSAGGSTPPSSRPGRFEETDLTVTLSPGHWKPADARYGWSGGTAVRSE